MESLPTSVQELKTGLFRVIWNTNSNISRNNGGYRHNYSSLNCSSKVDLTSLGVDECYEIQSSMDNNNGNAYNQIPVLKLTITTSDENIDNFKQRKINARFLGYDKEMVLTSNATSDIKEVKQKSEIDRLRELKVIPEENNQFALSGQHDGQKFKELAVQDAALA